MFPLHLKRFVRRHGNGSPLGAELPLYRSEPDTDSIVHSPVPQRIIPPIQAPRTVTPPEESESSSPGRLAIEQSREGWYNDKSISVAKIRPSPFAHLHGTVGQCVRHGRKLGPQGDRRFHGTTGMFETGRSGAYIPVGILEMRQMEATSPWAQARHIVNLTSFTGTKPMAESDACPDCITELGIRNRERNRSAASTARRLATPRSITPRPPRTPSKTTAPKVPFDVTTQKEDKSLKRVAPAPGDTSTKSVATVMRPPNEEQESTLPATCLPMAEKEEASIMTSHAAEEALSKRSASVPAKSFDKYATLPVRDTLDEPDNDALVMAIDLGEGLDAVILERGGVLERVITNLRHGTPSTEAIMRLSREMMLISNAIASAHLKRSPSSHASQDSSGDRAMVVDTRDGRQKSVPQILGLIDEVASVGLDRDPTLHTQRRREKTSYSTPFETLLDAHSEQPVSQRTHWPNVSTASSYFTTANTIPKLEVTSLEEEEHTIIPTDTFQRERSLLSSSPLQSPALFTASTCPSLTASPTSTPPPPLSPLMNRATFPPSSQARADTQVIRAAMRMEKSKAVQEAAATERSARRQRQIGAAAKKALG